MAEMTPDYEIGDDVMYASDQRSVGIPAKVLALTAPNGNRNYLQIKTADGPETLYDVQLNFIYGRPKKADGSPCILIDSNADFNNCHAIERDAVVQYRNINDGVESRERATVVQCFADNT